MNGAQYDELALLEAQYQQELARSMQMQSMQPAFFGSMGQARYEDNTVKWQLDIREILEQADHLLRGHRIQFDQYGGQHWVDAADPADVVLNDYGVSEVMRILAGYVNKNTMLSNLDQKQIHEIMHEFGIRLNDLFYMDYHRMGLDNSDKIKKAPLLILQIIDMVYVTFQRSMNGEERRSLHEMISINQTGPLGQQMNYGQSQPIMNEHKPGLFSRLVKGVTG